MKKLLLMLMLALPLATGIAVTIWSISTSYADPPDPRSGKP
jgi:hypothetical protein